ncbi:MAG: hypothetical protein R3F01_11580 [Lysobacteraceae bacterium]
MIYGLAFLLSVLANLQVIVLGIIARNLDHVKHGRTPNAGAELLPIFPLAQLTALGLAWLLMSAVPRIAVQVLLIGYAAFSLVWLVEFVRAKRRLSRQL